MTVDGDSPFCHLVFTRLEVRNHLFSDFGQISSLDIIIRLEEDFSETRLANRVVFEIEFVKPVEGVRVCLAKLAKGGGGHQVLKLA